MNYTIIRNFVLVLLPLGMTEAASGQNNEESNAAVIYGFSKEDLVLQRVMTINDMQHVADITDDPATGDLWVIGFNNASTSNNPYATQPCLAYIASGSNQGQIVDLLDSDDLGLPMSMVWTGDMN